MNNFGETLFGGGRFIRWTLSPVVLLFAIFMPLLIEKWTLIGIVLIVVMELMCVSLLIGFWLPSRFGRWAFRGLTGLVFLAYAGYVISEFFFSHEQFKISETKAEASPYNALCGFIIIGLPCLWYSLFGRFTLKPSKSEQEIDKIKDGEE